MKQIIFFSSLFVFSLLVSCGETKEDAKEETKASFVSIKIQEIGLEVMTKDLGKPVSWDDAKRACADLGDGWRLPTKEELGLMYINKDKIGGFAIYGYWSSMEDGANVAWGLNFFDGGQFGYYKVNLGFVRAVRTLK
jgi:hypothetical protein